MSRMDRCYTWEYRIEVPPYERLVDVLEAFFASYAGGDYTCEKRESYRLAFRRGAWKKSIFGIGGLVPDALPKGQFNKWPVLVYALVRPSPANFLATIRYELHLPRAVPGLIPEVRASVDQYCRRELADLAAYLAECIKLPAPPPVL